MSEFYTYKNVGRDLCVVIDSPQDVGEPCPCIVFFTGGGFRYGGYQQFETQARYFSKKGFVCARICFRNRKQDGTQKITILDCLDDAAEGICWIKDNAEKLHVDCNMIIGAGSSAGSFLVASLCVTGRIQFCGLTLYNPVLDIIEVGQVNRTMYNWLCKVGVEKLQEISPLQNVTADLPPTFIVVGEFDPYKMWTEAFATSARECGVKVEQHTIAGMSHGFTNRTTWRIPISLWAHIFLQRQGLCHEAFDLSKI